jgi:hypothetical protein
MHARKERPEWGSVYAQNEAIKDVFARCQEKTAVQVCTLIIMHCCLVIANIHVMICTCYHPALAIYPCHPCMYRIGFITLTGVYFLQVKNKL